MSRILLVEDDQLIGTMVRLNLAQEGFEVVWLKSAEPAVAAVAERRFDALLLDITLPGMSGIELARTLRAQGLGTPILMLTARDDTATKVEALDGGADDYVSKPFDIAELVARVRAQIRRSQGSLEVSSDREIELGGATVDLERRTIRAVDGSTFDVSSKELKLLQLFASNPRKVLSRATILEEVWGMDVAPTERTVDNFVVRLRRWIEQTPERPRHIHTVRGEGYRFEP
jgi:DNA-binding response OmpR family regulator